MKKKLIIVILLTVLVVVGVVIYSTTNKTNMVKEIVETEVTEVENAEVIISAVVPVGIPDEEQIMEKNESGEEAVSDNLSNKNSIIVGNTESSSAGIIPVSPTVPSVPTPDVNMGVEDSEVQMMPDSEASKPTMEDLENLAPGAQIGDTGFTWGAGVGGLGTQTPTTDGYGNGVDITIEPVN